ncbi:hypothetical protein Taro_024257 [Colocasia esculenta]|uniref:LOV domain-containing protein n=1 Tax=Colocasia esculenta TaxID=4460 RepID=A0A843VGY4_COLES|nr:hypothetical protein [Colocasia esculenta]
MFWSFNFSPPKKCGTKSPPSQKRKKRSSIRSHLIRRFFFFLAGWGWGGVAPLPSPRCCLVFVAAAPLLLPLSLSLSLSLSHGLRGWPARSHHRRPFPPVLALAGCCRDELICGSGHTACSYVPSGASPATLAAAVVAKMDPLVGRSLASRYSDWILEALDELPGNFLISDPCIAGHPIVFASRGFLGMSGYAREEVVGRNGRIFQGPGTDRRSVIEIREAIREERTMQISILNYRKDGSPMWILFHLCPVFGREDGQVIHFVAIQVPISRQSRGGQRQGPRCPDGGRGFVMGTCRKEVCGEVELRCNLAVDSFVDSDNRGLEAEESCEASDMEKQKAVDAANSVLSTLTHYSELTGRIVCRTRCTSVGVAPLASSLNISLGRIKQSFVLTDPQLPDMPIVYASDAFLNLTGYSRHEVLGRNCRFLNGSDTSLEALQQVDVNLIRESIGAAKACTVRILNYKKDGNTFWNCLHISPVRNASGKIAFHVWVQMDEAAKTDEQGLSLEMRQLGAVGAIKVAVRSLSAGAGPSRS